MNRVLTLSAALATVLASTTFYANNIRAPIDARSPRASTGSITLAVDPAAAAVTAGRIAQAAAPALRKLRMAIVWTSAREVS